MKKIIELEVLSKYISEIIEVYSFKFKYLLSKLLSIVSLFISYFTSQLNTKQDKLTAGENITIRDNTISAKGGETYNAGRNIDITGTTISAKGYVYNESDMSFGEVLGVDTGWLSHTEGGYYIDELYIRKLTEEERQAVYDYTGKWYDYMEYYDALPDGKTGLLIVEGSLYIITESAYVETIGDVDVFNTDTPILEVNEEYTIYAEAYICNEASGDRSHAEGSGTHAQSVATHAEGQNTTAAGDASHAEGRSTYTQGISAHAEGTETMANNNYSHAEGLGTKTSNNCEHAEGSYNASHTNTRHSIGIGTYNNSRQNAIEVMTDGRMFVKDLGGYNGTNPENAQTLQNVINNIQTNKVSIVTIDRTSGSTINTSIDPNKMYLFGEKTSITVTLNLGEAGVVNEYMFQFTSGSTATTLNVPSSVKWLKAPNISTNKVYQVSIENNLGIIGEWSNE